MKMFLALLMLAGLAPPAYAGDTAELEILGFSSDGKIFAFEEYGVQDGSGFPYANRFYLDTEQDSFLPGTPIRVRIDTDGASVEEARTQAAQRGETILSQAELAANRGTTAGARPVTQLSGDPHRIAVLPRAVFPPIDKPLEIALEEMPFETSPDCAHFGETKGFRLVRMASRPGETAQLLHEDSAVPQSRRCPLGYGIGAIQTFYPDGAAPVFVVLVAVRSVGFEGPDHRWIAVPGRL